MGHLAVCGFDVAWQALKGGYIRDYIGDYYRGY